MRVIRPLVILLALIWLTPDVYGQTRTGQYDPNNRLPDWVLEAERKRRAFERMSPASARRVLGLPVTVASDRGDLLVTSDPLRTMLRPPDEYWRRHGKFLESSETGMFRIFPRSNCDQGLTLSPEDSKKCRNFIPIKGGGSYYSFRLQSNLPLADDSWDLQFENGHLKGGNSSVQVLMTELGISDLDAVKKGAAEFQSLKGFDPSRSLATISAQQPELEKGIEVKGRQLRSSVIASKDAVYGVRIVALSRGDNVLDRVTRGLDILLALQVVGEESDGSLVILWKAVDVAYVRRTLTK